jgi:hypothetical protein
MRFLALLDYQPDMDDLFIRPGDAVRPPREPARHRARGGLRGSGRNLLVLAVSAVIAVSAFLGGAALVGSVSGAAQAPRLGIPPLAPLPATASASGSPSATVSASPSAPGARLNRMKLAPAMTPVHHATPQMSPVAVTTSTSAATPTVTVSSTATSGQRAVTVSYAVDEQDGASFRAEVDVINDGSSPISGWQIVVALPEDQITDFANATGYVSHHILLLQPASSEPAIAPGATLRVFFSAVGTETAPTLCAFNNVTCG